jgi:DNA-binding XRE family transcriptional regulator
MSGVQLKAARIQLGLTQAQLAKSVGLSRVSIARFEMEAKTRSYPVPRWLSLVVRMWLSQQ